MTYKDEIIRKVADIYVSNQDANAVTRGAHNVFCKETIIGGYKFIRQITPHNSDKVSIKKKSFFSSNRAVLDIKALEVNNFDLIEEFYINHMKGMGAKKKHIKIKI